jgi:hypothetical protein
LALFFGFVALLFFFSSLAFLDFSFLLGFFSFFALDFLGFSISSSLSSCFPSGISSILRYCNFSVV